MKSNYKRLGDFIQVVNVRNKALQVKRLLGVSINKVLMPSIANVIGTNMKTYKIIKRNQFVYGPVTSRNGDKISIALLEDYDEAILSQAYTVFEIIDTSKLLPQYLMMWFRRPEFDRYARFKSHGSARETFDWSEMCEVTLPILSIEKQQAIVKEYQTITNRIALNEQLNEKLEATAQALYKHWFVDFEFPNKKGLPYKSNGGEMVWNEVLEKDLPLGWEVGKLDDYCNIYDNKRKPLSSLERKDIQGIYPYYGAMGIIDYVNDFLFEGTFLLMSEDGVYVIDKNGNPSLQYVWGKFWVNNHAHVLQGKEIVSTEFLLLALKNTYVADLVTGAAQPKINQKNMRNIKIIVPENQKLEKFNKLIKKIYNLKKNEDDLSNELKTFKSVLLQKLATA